MTLEEYFARPQMQYPINYTGDFFAAFRDSLVHYAETIDEFSDPDFTIDTRSLHSNVKDFCLSLVESVQFLLDGSPSRAFSRLTEGMLPLRDIFLSEVFNTSIMPTLSGFYRIRTFEKPPGNLSCNDLFHVPFSARHKIRSERFSISGYPCLYLGSSSVICWHEMGRPKANHSAIVRYETSNDSSTSVIYLAYHPNRTPQAIRGFARSPLWRENPIVPVKVLSSILLIYPLVLACHFSVLHPIDPFKPEYIIPQLALQWILSETRIQGLCFVSTQVEFDKVPLPLSLNYVFPVPSAEKEYRNFRDRFHSSIPFIPTKRNLDSNWRTTQPEGRYFNLYGLQSPTPYMNAMVRDRSTGVVSYDDTNWGRIDRLLQNSVVVSMNDRESSRTFPSLDKLQRRPDSSWV